jgi:branched-chain amino acid transport system permease protein
MGLAWNVLSGYSGLVSFGHASFFGLGAYTTTLLLVKFGITPWIGIPISMLVGGFSGALIGWPTFRLRGHYFALAMLAYPLALLYVFEWLGYQEVAIPYKRENGFAYMQFADQFGYVVTATLMMVAAMMLSRWIELSRFGLALLAIKQNQPLALAHGVSPTPYKLFAFAVGAALTAVAGGIQVIYLKIVDPSILDFYYLQAWLIMVIIGGAGTFWGVVAAGILMSVLPEALRFSNELRMVIYGAILVMAVLAMPQGVAGWLRERRIARLRETLQ